MSSYRARGALVIAVLVLLVATVAYLAGPDGERGSKTRGTFVERLLGSLGMRRLSHQGDEAGRKKKPTRDRKGEKPGTKARAPITSCTVFGIVQNEKGQPVGGARVMARPSGLPSGKATSSDARGRFEITGISAGVYDLAASHPQYADIVHRGVTLQSRTPRLEVTFRLPLGATLVGKVQDEEGKPLAAVRVTARRRKMEQLSGGGNVYLDDASYKTRDTDQEGSFTVTGVSLGDVLMDLAKPGYDSQSRELKIDASSARTPLKITLTRSGVIGGLVVNESNNPVTSAVVRLTRYRPFGGEQTTLPREKYSIMSGEGGAFRFKKLLNEGFYDLAIESPNYAPGLFPSIPAGTDQLTCVLGRGGVIEGKAQYLDRDTTAAKMLISLRTVSNGTTYSTQVATNEEGEFAVARLPYGKYTVASATTGLVVDTPRELYSVRDKPTTGVIVQVFEAASASGHVYDAENDQPVGSATVTIQAAYGPKERMSKTFRTTTNNSGEFEFSQLPAGFHVAQAVAQALHRTPSGTSAQTFTLLPGEDLDGLVLRLSHGGTVEGYVSSANGSKLEGADVQLYLASQLGQVSDTRDLKARTDATGYFKIYGIKVGESIQLYASARKHGYAKGHSSLIELTAQEPEAMTQITLLNGGGVTGRVTGPSGEPLADARLRVSSREFPGDPSSSLITAASEGDGTYLAEHCSPGKTRVIATCEGFVQQAKEITISDNKLSTLNFKLAKGNGITGRVSTFEGAPIANARVTARPLQGASGVGEDITDKKGDYAIVDLGKGTFRVEAAFQISTTDGSQNYAFILPRVESGTGLGDIDCDVDNTASGRVEGDDDKGLNQFRITLRSRTDTEPVQDFRFSVERLYSAARGFFRIQSIPRGVYKLEVSAKGYETYLDENLIVGPGKRTVFSRIRMKRSGGIKGMLISSTTERPINNASIRVLDAMRPEFQTLTKREYQNSSNREIAEIIDPDLLYDPIDPSNENLPVVRVRANVVTSGRSEYDGQFEISGAPAGTYNIDFDHPDYITQRMTGIRLLRREDTDLGRIYLEPGGALMGRVFDQNGAPIYDATVMVPDMNPVKKTRTDSAGKYQIRGIRPGTWLLVVKGTMGGRKTHAFVTAQVEPDKTNPLDIYLNQYASMRLVLQGAPAYRSGSTRLYAVDSRGLVYDDIYYDAPLGGGAFSVSGIPAGTYFAKYSGAVASGNFVGWNAVSLNPGTNSVTPLFPKASYRGLVVQADEGVAGVSIQLRPMISGVQLPNSIYNGLIRSTTTGATGGFSLLNLAAGQYQALYAPPGSGWVALPSFTLSEGQAIRGIWIGL